MIESYSEDPLAQCATVAGSQALLEWARHNLRRGVSILQREGRLGSATRRWPQALWDGYGGFDFEQDWTDHRPISRSLVKPRKTALASAGDNVTPTPLPVPVPALIRVYNHALKALFCFLI